MEETDKTRLVNLLTDFGCNPRVEEKEVFLEEGASEKVGGYGGFFTVFTFDDDDNFVKCELFE
ncbi:MAG: hypothetical protein KAS32_10700 [Candidatus Peribacteraceae bacterium]|nr:hypothetical protein [Candidatus Peribacteraceae bacterium]